MARTDYGAILSSVIKDTSDAIRDVKGTSGLIAPADWASEIRGIQKKSNDVNYFDAFGNILFGYSAEQFAELTEHPTGTNITSKGVELTFDSWNYDFSVAQTHVAKYGKLNIGGIYHPTDGKTHIFLDIKNVAHSDIDINFEVKSSATIDWGDGSTETVSGEFTGKHNYNAVGIFEITIDGEIEIYTPSGTIFLPDKAQKTYLTDVFFCDITGIIYTDTFRYCSSLVSVTFPEGITQIGSYAFQYCTSLASVTIPKGVTIISNYAFAYCSSLKSIVIPAGTNISDYSFQYCTSLTSVTIPEGLSGFGRYAFAYCTSLASVTLPEGYRMINQNAFQYCTSLTSVTIPEGVTSISNYAFAYCTSLKSVTIPAGVKSINNSAFAYCTSLKSVTIPDSVTSIGTYAFQYCTSLTSVTIPEGVTSISNYAFAYCASLKSVTIPAVVKSINNSAFADCTNLTYVDLTAVSAVPTAGSRIFNNDFALDAIIVPDSLYDGFIAATNWSTYKSMMVKESEYTKPF